MLDAPIQDKNIATNIQEKFENESKRVNTNLPVESEKARVLQENLDKARKKLKMVQVFTSHV